MNAISLHPLLGIGSVQPGDNLAALVVQALDANQLQPQAGDVLVIAQKIISKAENRYRSLAAVTPSVAAQELAATTRKDPRLVELVLQESSTVVRACPGVLIVRDHNGFVMANAGIDASNLDGDDDQVLLLPVDADASAAALRQMLQILTGIDFGIVIADSFGRPWRDGVTNVAIGAAGVAALLDKRDQPDRAGRKLQVTQVAIGDLLASAAGLLLGESDESIPVVVVRGLSAAYRGNASNYNSAASLVRPAAQDLFK